MVAVGTVVATQSPTVGWPSVPVFKISIAWTCDASGNVSGTPITGVAGVLTRCTTIPDAVLAPTTLYDITLLDDDGVDLLAGLGANRSATVTESVAPMLGSGTNVPVVCLGSLNLVIANAGNAKKGVINLYFERRAR